MTALLFILSFLSHNKLCFLSITVKQMHMYEGFYVWRILCMEVSKFTIGQFLLHVWLIVRWEKNCRIFEKSTEPNCEPENGENGVE